jgi:hypothetical protein
MIYFQGTDNTLWRMKRDGSGGTKVAGFKTASSPVVFGDHIFFRGTDNQLWRSDLDGSNGMNLGGNKTNSTPCVTGEYVYFQGIDNRLLRVGLDGSGGTQLQGWQTASTPFALGQYIYFQGTDNKLWKINSDGNGGTNLGNNKTSSAPVANAEYVFFRGTDDQLWRINQDGTGGTNLGGNKTSSTPCVAGDYVFFRGNDNRLWRIGIDGKGGKDTGFKTSSTPMVDIKEGFIYFQGTDNALWRTTLDGSNSNHLGGFATASTPFVVTAANQPVTGTARPKYMVLTVIYSPPGTTPSTGGGSGEPSSSVIYGNVSSTGTTSTISSSFQKGIDIKASESLSVPVGGNIAKIGATEDFNTSTKTTNTSSIAVTKSQTHTITVPGPSTDGIDHDEDYFYLWLNPQIAISIDPQDNLNWGLGVDGPTMNIQFAHAGWLKDPSKMPPGLKQQLDNAKLTTSDYKKILSLNPFADGGTKIDKDRFIPTPFSFPYEPPFAAGDTVPTETYALQSVVMSSSSKETDVTYGVSVSVSAGLEIPKVFTADVTTTGTFTWTNSSTTLDTSQSTQTASVTIGGPSFGYTGSTDVLVFWDSVYNSFMFAFPHESPSVSGSVTGKDGKPVARKSVKLTVGSRPLETITSATGKFNFFHADSGSGKLDVSGEEFPVTIGSKTADATLKLTKS